MNPPITSSVVLLLSFALTSAAAERREASLATMVQRVLAMQSHDAQIVPALEQVISGAGHDNAKKSQAEEQLVASLNRGARPDALSSVILPSVHIQWASAFQLKPAADWKLGSADDRAGVAMNLLSKAKKMAGSSPAKARSYARAALLLAAHEEFIRGWDSYYRIVAAFEDSRELREAAQIGPNELKQLRDTADAYYKSARQFMPAFDEALSAIDHLLKADGLPEKLVNAALEKLAKLIPTTLGQEWRRAFAVWSLRNVVASRNSAAMLEKIDAVIRKLRDQATDANAKRWLGEALERTAKPRRLIGHWRELPNGETIEIED